MTGGRSSIATQLDLFKAQIVDVSLRDERDAMEFPMFSLSKKKRTTPMHYKRHGIEILVTAPSDIGIATIWDADFILWVASQLNEAINRGLPVSPRLWVVPHQFMLQTGRIGSNPSTRGGSAYAEFKGMIRRLGATSVFTNIEADGRAHEQKWSWVSEYSADIDSKKRVTGLEVQIPTWLFSRIVKDRAVLSITPEYFQLSGGIERWLYRIARKMAGRDPAWEIPLHELHARYPAGREFKKFKSDLRRVVTESSIPEYSLVWVEDRDAVAFFRRSVKPPIPLQKPER